MKKKNAPFKIEGFITDENGIPRIRVDKSGDMHNHWVERVKDENGDSHDVYKLGLLNQKDPLQEYDWDVNPPQKIYFSRTIDLVLGVILCGAIGTLLAMVLLEWIVGCGEVTYFADGTWITNECLFQDNKISKGTWK